MFVVGCLFTVIVRLYVHLGDPGPAAFYLFGKAVPIAALISCLDLIFMIEGFLGIFLIFFYDNGNERFMLLSGTKRNVSGSNIYGTVYIFGNYID